MYFFWRGGGGGGGGGGEEGRVLLDFVLYPDAVQNNKYVFGQRLILLQFQITKICARPTFGPTAVPNY